MATAATTELDLRELTDPEFFVRWAQIRLRYAVTNPARPEHQLIKQDYADVLAEYRRRLDGPR